MNTIYPQENNIIPIADLAKDLQISKKEVIRISKENGISPKITFINETDASKIRKIVFESKYQEIKNQIQVNNDSSDKQDHALIRINSIKLENFKSYTCLRYNCNTNFNVIIGENNVGKSSIFDSILLWGVAYKKLITTNETFYKPIGNNELISITIEELISLRIIKIKDIFNDHNNPCYISLEIVTPENISFNLRIKFETSNINELHLLIKISDSYSEFYRFQEYCKEKVNNKERLKIRNAFSVKMSQPVANIIRNENFYNKALVMQKTNTGYSFEVLRNKILNTKDEKNKFSYLEEKLHSVLNKNFKIRWKNENKEIDVNIRLTIEEEGGQEVDLSLVGSGVLNLLEIFSSLHSKLDGINIVLLDEPDSHIHSNIQHKLIEQLKTDPLGSQVFIITHNDRLIYSVNQEELFYLNVQSKKIGALDYFPLIVKNIEQLEYKLSGYLEKAEHSYKNRPVIFVEGETDKLILEATIKKHYPKYLDLINIKYDNGHSGVADMAISWHHQRIEKKAVALFDHDEAAMESIKKIDDFIPESKRTNFKVFTLEKYKPLHIRSFYQESIKISFAIEELFNIGIWDHFQSNDFLVTKNGLPPSPEIDKSLKDHCLERGIEESYLIYLKKVKREKKIKAAKHIASLINTTDTETIGRLVVDILRYLFETKELESTENPIKSKVSLSEEIEAESAFPSKKSKGTDNLIAILLQAWEKYKDDQGWTNIASIGNYIKNIIKDFHPQQYGANKLTDLISSLPDYFEMKKYKGKGTVNIVAFRPTQKF